MRVIYRLVESELVEVDPGSCRTAKVVGASTPQAIQDACAGCAVFVFDGELWIPLDDDTPASLLVDNALLRVVQAAAQAPPPRQSLLHPDDIQLEEAFGRVSDVILEVEEAGKITKQNIGTIARIREDGLCVSATHVWVKEGALLPAVAFGDQVTLVASFPYYDVILLQLPTGLRQPTIGTQVMMLAHAVAHMKDLLEPTVSEGCIVAAAPNGELVAADYHAAMPSASGAPVLYDSRTFAGTHLGASFHRDQTYADREDEAEAPWNQVDLDPQSMWPSSTASGSGGTQAPRKRKPTQPAQPIADLEMTVKEVHRLALHAASNIEHKDQLPLFVPAQRIIDLAIHSSALPAPAMHQAAKLSSR